MIRPAIAAVLALLAAKAGAQDVTGQYAAMQTMFVWPGVADSTDAADYLAAAEPLIEGLRGDWLAVDHLAMGSGQYDATQLAEHCARLHVAITPTSPFSFDMTMIPRAADAPRLTMRFDYAGFNQFNRSRDTAAFLERMGLTGMGAETPPAIFAGTGTQGSVALFHPSGDILFLQPAWGRPEVYARCPK